MTLEHNTSHKSHLKESIFENLRVLKKNLNIEKIIFKVVYKFLAMHVTSFDIFTIQNIFIEHDLNI